MKYEVMGCKGKTGRCLKTGICSKSGEPVVYDDDVLICPDAIIDIESTIPNADSQRGIRGNPNHPAWRG